MRRPIQTEWSSSSSRCLSRRQSRAWLREQDAFCRGGLTQRRREPRVTHIIYAGWNGLTNRITNTRRKTCRPCCRTSWRMSKHKAVHSPSNKPDHTQNVIEICLNKRKGNVHRQMRPENPDSAAGRSKARNLLERLQLYEQDVPRFMIHPIVPSTNNQGDCDIMMTKVHHKISGCFRSLCIVPNYV